MAFENYSDIQEGDMIECFEIKKLPGHWINHATGLRDKPFGGNSYAA